MEKSDANALTDVGEVHVIPDNDVPIELDQRGSNEENKVGRGNRFGGPNCFPNPKYVLIQ